MNETRHMRARAVVAALAIVAFVVLAAAAGTYELELWGGKTVPAVRGIAEGQAVREMQEKGFAVEVEERPSDSGIGYVLETDPAAGSRLEDGSTVKLVVSANRTVPNVTGLSLAEARDALDEMGAQNVSVTYDSSRDEAEGTVLGVDPAEGTVITSSDEVKLVVAQAPVVPDVVGKTEADALKALEDVSLTANITYVQSSSGKKGTVLSSSPAAGKTADDSGVVQLTVINPNPEDYCHLLEYFSCEAGGLGAWLEEQGLQLTVGYRSSDNHATERFEDDQGDAVTFSSQPWQGSIAQPSDSEAKDVIASGAFYDGLRLELSESQSPDAGATQASAQQMAELCGLGDASDFCTQADITKPDAGSSPRANFYCASGEEGDYSWVVLIEASSGTSTRAVCVAGPTELFKKQDLSQYGDSLCDFVAYQEMYERS